MTRWVAMAIADVPAVPDLEPGEPDWKPLGHHFRLRSFGANAYSAAAAGGILLHLHDELSGGHEELYAVLSGVARFTLGEETCDARAGTVVAVRDPAVERSAIALVPGTTVLAVGAKPGEAFAGSTWGAQWFEHVPQIPADDA